jgi:hypothetical protein
VSDHHRRLGRFETVALRGVARRQAQGFHRHHGLAMQGNEAMRGAHEVHAAPAGQLAVGFQLVGHHLGDGQLAQGVVERLLQAHHQRGPGHDAVPVQGFGLAFTLTLETAQDGGRIADVGAQGGQFLQQRRRGLSIRAQSDRDGHEFLLHGLIGRLGQHRGDVRREPARRGKGRDDGAFARQPLRFELLEQDAGKRFAQLLQGLGGQLLHEELHQQIFRGHGQVPQAAFVSVCAASCATHSRGAMGKPRRSRLS